jgi:hypothetical protein
MNEQQSRQLQSRKIRTALILLSIAMAFFVGVIVRHWQ